MEELIEDQATTAVEDESTLQSPEVEPVQSEPAPLTATAEPPITAEPADDFDAESLELSFGLPPGSLKDVKDTESALEVVRNFTDQNLLRSLGVSPTEPQPEQPQQEYIDPRIQQLQQENAQLRNHFAEQTARVQLQLVQQLHARINAKIDSLADPVLGVTGTRNYRQTEAANAFRDRLLSNIAERHSLGLPIEGVIESYVDRMHSHLSADRKAPAPKPTHAWSGTPGASKPSAAESGPRNIHQATFGG